MKSFYKLLFAAIFFPVFAFSQSNYKPGYVVNLKGDTLKGFINYQEWGTNPNAIDFKTTTADKVSRRFTPTDIIFFNITGLESYQRYVGPISMDAIDKDHVSYSRDTSYRVETVFFRVLQKAKNISLYAYSDILKTRFYVGETPDYAPKELVYRLYYNYGEDKVSGQKDVTVNENTYMKQLFALANKFGALNDNTQRDIERTDYSEDGILSIVTRINNISKAEYKKSGDFKGPLFNVFVGAGANIDNTYTQSGSNYEQGGGKSYTSTGAAVLAGLNFFVNPSTRRFQLRLEVGAAQSQFRSSYMLKVYPYIPVKASFDELSLSLSPQILYNFYNTDNFKFYASIGFVMNAYKYSNTYFGSQSQPNSISDIQANEPYLFVYSLNSYLVKFGFQIHKNWGIFAQYIGSNPITQNTYWALSSKSEQMGINYYFW